MVTVLGRTTSINVRKVLWALDELDMRYEREDWGLPLRDPNVPEFLKLNPNGQVPVLLDGDTVLWESNAILIHLAWASGRLLSNDVRHRAVALQWLAWQGSELNPAWSYAVQALVRRMPGYDDPARIAASMEQWTAKMLILEARLAGAAFVAGDAFSIADIALGLSVHRWMMTPCDKPALKAVAAYRDRLRERPAGSRWLAAETP